MTYYYEWEMLVELSNTTRNAIPKSTESFLWIHAHKFVTAALPLKISVILNGER